MPRLKRNYLVCHDRLFLIILGFPPFNWCSSTCFKINLAVLDVRVGLNFSLNNTCYDFSKKSETHSYPLFSGSLVHEFTCFPCFLLERSKSLISI